MEHISVVLWAQFTIYWSGSLTFWLQRRRCFFIFLIWSQWVFLFCVGGEILYIFILWGFVYRALWGTFSFLFFILFKLAVSCGIESELAKSRKCLGVINGLLFLYFIIYTFIIILRIPSYKRIYVVDISHHIQTPKRFNKLLYEAKMFLNLVE